MVAPRFASVPIWVFIGYAFGENIPQILAWVDRVKVWLFLVAVIAITIVVLRYSGSAWRGGQT